MDRSRLHGLLADGATVVTPNRRLARELKREFDLAQQASGRQVWPSADLLPWRAWLARCFDDAQPAAPKPMLLSPLQQQVWWRQILRGSRAARALVHVDAVGASADAAWALLHENADLATVAQRAGSDDQVAFIGWAREFARRLQQRHAVSAVQLPAWLVQALHDGAWLPRATLVLAGFDRLSAAQHGLIAALQAAHVAVVEVPEDEPSQAVVPVRIECADLWMQWQQVAAWAAARLRAVPQARIGIVVPDLGAQRDALVHALTDALMPSLRIQPEQDGARPFNLSLGGPLAQEPLVATALDLFDLMCGPLEVARIGSLLRSPFVAGGAVDEVEWSRRARLDRALRDDGMWQLTLDQLRRAAGRTDADGQPHAEGAPWLSQALGRAAHRVATTGTRRQSLSTWVALLFGALQDLGFPGSRTLDSVEFQALARWRELMASLSSLDTAFGPATLTEAVGLLRRAAGDTVFQAESADVPVQVLGVLESAHLRFDCLWVANLSDERWPAEVQPNPLLPLVLQRGWQVPNASPDLALAHARHLMMQWASSTAELVFSHALREGDRQALPSPLIASTPARPFTDLAAPETVAPAMALRRDVGLDPVIDEQAPALDTMQAVAMRGGTRLFADQSACPFRAFATHRLHAQPLQAPAPGLDPVTRGGLLHTTLEAFWTDLGSQAALRALGDGALHTRVSASADRALDVLAQRRPGLLGPRLRELERERLLRAVHAWLDIEDARPPFTVVTVEVQAEIGIGGIHLSVRPDRVDRLEDGSLAIIDYKTGRASVNAWLDERPDQPQLPLYATAYAAGAMPGGVQPVGVIAFAQLRPGETKVIGLAARDGLIPGAQVIGADEVKFGRPGWDGLIEDWRTLLERLARQFVRGDAAVAPKALPATCAHCELPLLCRREERESFAARVAEGDDAERIDE